MAKYLIKRILFSILSIIIVVGVVTILIYSLMDREAIFATDPVIAKRQDNELVLYKYNKWQDYNYLTYVNGKSTITAYLTEEYGENYFERQEYKDYYKLSRTKGDEAKEAFLNNDLVKRFKSEYEAKGYRIEYYPPVNNSNSLLIGIYEKNVFERVWDYFSRLFKFETIHDVPETENIERYIRWEFDPMSNMPALVGSGTTHKYLIYFDNIFPYIHQNIVHLNLGESYVTYRGSTIIQVMNNSLGSYKVETKVNRMGETEETALNYHTVTYSSFVTSFDKTKFPDNYINPTYNFVLPSRMANSFMMGIISVIIAYMLGLPLGVLNARNKDRFFDKLGNIYIIFIMAVPSLAYIFIFASIGTGLFKLPYNFQTAEVKTLAYILPTISLALPSVGSLMKWMRRYMIDQMNSDYVKFARSQGLSENEIFQKHISPNAMIYLVHGIPGSILGSLTGAIITERVYNVDGVGNLITNAINRSDNGVIVGVTFFYTFLSVLSLILGDLLLAKYDPRVNFTEGAN